MSNIERRLSKAEAAAAKTENVDVRFTSPEREPTQMPLIDAVRLLMNGEAIEIRRILRQNEERKYLNDTIKEIENYVRNMEE